jgi:hypothetical protein
MRENLLWSGGIVRWDDDRGGGQLTDPDLVRAIDGNGIAAPDELRVQLGDVNVLDDDILRAVGDAEPLSTEDTLVADTDERLVGADGEPADAGLVVGDLDGGRARTSVAVGAPAGLVDGVLATVSGALVRGRPAAVLGDGALSALEVELLVEDDTASSAIAKPGLQLSGA